MITDTIVIGIFEKHDGRMDVYITERKKSMKAELPKEPLEEFHLLFTNRENPELEHVRIELIKWLLLDSHVESKSFQLNFRVTRLENSPFEGEFIHALIKLIGEEHVKALGLQIPEPQPA